MGNLKYIKYLYRHKLYVYQAGRVTGAPLWRLLIHDWSKLRPIEWVPYRELFYGPKRTEKVKKNFNQAWLKHIHANPHHWNHWTYIQDSGNVKSLDMPVHFVQEMVADWAGAGRAVTSYWDILNWYKKNHKGIRLTFNTRMLVHHYLQLFAKAKKLGNFEDISNMLYEILQYHRKEAKKDVAITW